MDREKYDIPKLKQITRLRERDRQRKKIVREKEREEQRSDKKKTDKN